MGLFGIALILFLFSKSKKMMNHAGQHAQRKTFFSQIVHKISGDFGNKKLLISKNVEKNAYSIKETPGDGLFLSFFYFWIPKRSSSAMKTLMVMPTSYLEM